MKVSYSSIMDYFKCRTLNYNRRVLGLKSLRYEDNIGKKQGEVFHKVVSSIDQNAGYDEIFLAVSEEIDAWRRMLISLYRNLGKEYTYPSGEIKAMKQLIAAKVYAYLRTIPPMLNKVSSEYRIEIPIGDGVVYTGYVDAVYDYYGMVILGETKVKGAWSKSSEEYMKIDVQSKLYKWAYERATGDPVSGILYTVVSAPNYRQKKTETRRDLYQRIANEIMNNPQNYVFRYLIVKDGEAFDDIYLGSDGVIEANLDKIGHQKTEEWLNSVVEDMKRSMNTHYAMPAMYPSVSYTCTGCEFYGFCFEGEGIGKHFVNKTKEEVL